MWGAKFQEISTLDLNKERKAVHVRARAIVLSSRATRAHRCARTMRMPRVSPPLTTTAPATASIAATTTRKRYRNRTANVSVF